MKKALRCEKSDLVFILKEDLILAHNYTALSNIKVRITPKINISDH